jgi:hypothetical protein
MRSFHRVSRVDRSQGASAAGHPSEGREGCESRSESSWRGQRHDAPFSDACLQGDHQIGRGRHASVCRAVATDATMPKIPRVRANRSAIAVLLLEAPKRSATFRRLIEAIDASDGIIERGTCLHGVQACLAMSVVVSGPNRILRVVLDTSVPRKRSAIRQSQRTARSFSRER